MSILKVHHNGDSYVSWERIQTQVDPCDEVQLIYIYISEDCIVSLVFYSNVPHQIFSGTISTINLVSSSNAVSIHFLMMSLSVWQHMESEMLSTLVFWWALCMCDIIWKTWYDIVFEVHFEPLWTFSKVKCSESRSSSLWCKLWYNFVTP